MSSSSALDIGAYDGGFERENVPHLAQDAAEALKLSVRKIELDNDFDRAGSWTEWGLRDFDIGRPLGKGQFGRVYLARVKSPTNPFILALKCLSKEEVLLKEVGQQVRREIEIMRQLRHPNVIRLYGFFHDPNRIFLMLEFAGQGEVFTQLAKAGRFSEKRSSRVSVPSIADGLAYLHSKNVIHRDIKPENLLLGLNGEIKIGDFGWSVYSPEDHSRKTYCGTLSYVSPEMILQIAHGRAVDNWALGVLAYEFVCGQEPFAADVSMGPRLVHRRICQCDVRVPSHVSAEGKDFILALLRLSPSDRLPLDQVPLHPWIIANQKR
ncbi:hypothetical protein P7C73_g1405, partial [Tremellales sp. Uapishka_1]